MRRGLKAIRLAFLTLTILSTEPSIAVPADIRISSNGNLYIVGKLIPGDFERFKSALRSGTTEIGFVELRTGGGSVVEGLAIGRLVRSLYLNTNAPWSSQSGAQQPYCRHDARLVGLQVPCLCASACFFIWVAGFFRYGDEIHIHRIYFDQDFYGPLDPDQAAEKYKQGLQVVHSYLREMDVPEKYYERMLKTSSDSSSKISWNEAANDFGFWPVPALQEWLIARCGGYRNVQSSQQAEAISSCWMREQKGAQRAAMQKFLSH
jgi:hypothetical protein